MDSKKDFKCSNKVTTSIESIASGALAMTLKIKDILTKGISIKLLNRRKQKHFWHPIFSKVKHGQLKTHLNLSFKPVKIIRNICNNNWRDNARRYYDVIFENGLPKISEIQAKKKSSNGTRKFQIVLKHKSDIGEDNIPSSISVKS